MRLSIRRLALGALQFLSIGGFLLASPSFSLAQSTTTSEVREHYNPAVLKLIYSIDPSKPDSSFLDTILIPVSGEATARRIKISPKQFAATLGRFYADVASLRPLNPKRATSPSRQLHDILIGPLDQELRSGGITTLLISANPGLQAIPFAALHDGEEWFGTRFSFSLTPSLSLMPNQGGDGRETTSLLAGASSFNGLAPLPLVEQELEQIARIRTGSTYLNDKFTRQIFDDLAKQSGVDLVHLSTHAEFLPGGPEKSKLYLGEGSLSINDFAKLRLSRDDKPFELFTLSACRTALGDRDSELGLAGLALQAGAKTAIGSLWYVDDLATTIYFIRFYRLMNQGLPKGEAMRQVREEFSNNQIFIRDQTAVDKDGELLISNLTPSQQRKLKRQLDHPFFWAAPIMLGLPW